MLAEVEKEIHVGGFGVHRDRGAVGQIGGKGPQLVGRAVVERPLNELHVVQARIRAAEIADHEFATGAESRKEPMHEMVEILVREVVEESRAPDEIERLVGRERKCVGLHKFEMQFKLGSCEKPKPCLKIA